MDEIDSNTYLLDMYRESSLLGTATVIQMHCYLGVWYLLCFISKTRCTYLYQRNNCIHLSTSPTCPCLSMFNFLHWAWHNWSLQPWLSAWRVTMLSAVDRAVFFSEPTYVDHNTMHHHTIFLHAITFNLQSIFIRLVCKLIVSDKSMLGMFDLKQYAF